MKRIITGALMLALSIGAVNAQTTDKKQDRGQRKEHRMGGMDQLNLTADQKAQLKQLHERERTEMEALRNNKSLSAEAAKAQRETLHQKYRSEMSAILTPEQRSQFEKNQAERKATGKDFKGDFKKDGNRANGKGKRGEFGKDMNLTADQKKQIQDIRSTYKPRFEALHADKTLSNEAKRTQMKSLMQEQQSKINAVLTPEQQEKMKGARNQRGARSTK